MTFILFSNVGILILIILFFIIKQIKSSFTNSKNDKSGTKYIEFDSKEKDFNKEGKEKQIPKERYTARKLFEMGYSCQTEGKYQEALEYYDKAILAKPNYAYAWYKKGEVFLNLCMYQEAIKCFEVVKNIDPDLYCSLIGKNGEDALQKRLESYNKERDKVSNNEENTSKDEDIARFSCDIGRKLSNDGRYNEAIEFFDKAILADPNYAYAWYNKGVAFLKMGRYQKGMNCFKEIEKFDSKSYFVLFKSRYTAKILFEVGSKLSNDGRYNEAIEFFDKAILADPNYVDALYNKGRLYYNIKNYEEAIKCYDKVTSIKPKDANTWYDKGQAYIKIGMREEARICYEKSESINSKYAASKQKHINKSIRKNVKKCIEDIDNMNGYNFESFIGSLYEKMGYSVEQTPKSGDQGADLIITKFGEKTAVQTKNYKGKVSNKAIQEVVASKEFYGCVTCTVVTNSYFTKSAIKLGNVNNVKLIDRDELEFMIKNT